MIVKTVLAPLLRTAMDYSPNINEQEKQFLAALSQVTSFQVFNKNLKMTTNDALTVLNFTYE